MPHLLLVEDDPSISSHLTALFRSEGWTSMHLTSGQELSELLLYPKETFSALVLDRLLGTTDTRRMIPEIRRRFPSMPILVLSAINSPLDRADLLELGVDDYLGKPFVSKELVARIKALCRRAHAAEENYRQVGNTLLSFDRFTLKVGDEKEFPLPQKEFLVLKLLSRTSGKVFSKDELLAAVWGEGTYSESNVVEVTINSLRRKLETCGSSCKVKNLRNVGYFVEA